MGGTLARGLAAPPSGQPAPAERNFSGFPNLMTLCLAAIFVSSPPFTIPLIATKMLPLNRAKRAEHPKNHPLDFQKTENQSLPINAAQSYDLQETVEYRLNE